MVRELEKQNYKVVRLQRGLGKRYVHELLKIDPEQEDVCVLCASLSRRNAQGSEAKKNGHADRDKDNEGVRVDSFLLTRA